MGEILVSIKGNRVHLTKEAAKELCETLMRKLYDDPTYEELNNKCSYLEHRIDCLEEQLEYHKQVS